MQTIFLVAGVVPIVLAVIALCAARMPRDEIAQPADRRQIPVVDRESTEFGATTARTAAAVPAP